MNTKPEMHPKPVQVRMKAETHQWIHDEAKRLDRSANWIINHVLDTARVRPVQQQQGGAQ